MSSAKFSIPQQVIERDGPFEEFKKDGSIVSVELTDGTVVPGVLLIYPNEVWAVRGCTDMPFDVASVRRVFQTEDDRRARSSSGWVFFGAPNAI